MSRTNLVYGGMLLFSAIGWFLIANMSEKSAQKTIPADNKDIMSLGLLLSGECLQCPLDEKFLAGSVVLTRLADPRYPKTIDKVIQEENQFHGFEAEQYCFDQVCWDISKWLIRGHKKPENVLFFWRNTQPKPSYVKTVTHKMKYHNFGI